MNKNNTYKQINAVSKVYLFSHQFTEKKRRAERKTKPRCLGCYMYFLLAPTILDEVAIVVHLVYTYLTRIQFDYKTYRYLRIRWCHLSTIPDTRAHCLGSTEGNVNFLGTRNLV